jgi:hypothetical protein
MDESSNVIYQLILERNALETDSFVDVYDALDELRSKFNSLESECYHQQDDLAKVCVYVCMRACMHVQL